MLGFASIDRQHVPRSLGLILSILVMVMGVMGLSVTVAPRQALAAATVKKVKSNPSSPGDNDDPVMTIDGQRAWCAQRKGHHFPSTGSRYVYAGPASDQQSYIAYYGPGGPGWNKRGWNAGGTLGRGEAFNIKHAIWIVSGCGMSSDYYSDYPEILKIANDARQHASGKGPWKGYASIWKPLDGSKQKLLVAGPPSGSLTLKKTLSGKEASSNKNLKKREFKITVTLKNGKKLVNGTIGGYKFKKGKHTFTLKGGESVTINLIPAGYKYSVTEAETAEFATKISNATGTIGKGKTDTVKVKNTSMCGGLEITKKVTGNDSGKKDTTSFAFTVTITDKSMKNKKFEGRDSRAFNKNGVLTLTKSLSDGQTWKISHLPVGASYKVTETANAAYATKAPSNATGTIGKNKSIKITYTNERRGSLKVTKKLVGTASNKNPEFSFTLLVTMSGKGINGTYGGVKFTNGTTKFNLHKNESKTFANLPRGAAYVVSETVPSGYKVEWQNERGKIQGGTTVSAIASNNDTTDTGLSVTKEVVSDQIDPDKEYSFKVTLRDTAKKLVSKTFNGRKFTNGIHTFKIKHDEEYSITGIPAGYTYEVEEDPVPGYVTTMKNATGTIQNNKVAVVSARNIDSKGSISITKQVVGMQNPTRKFGFTLTLRDSGGNGLSGTYEGTLESAPADVESAPADASQDEDDDEDEGEDTPQDEDEGEDTPRDEDEGVASATEVAQSCEFSDGRYSFTLKAGETLKIDGIPSKTTYELTEEPVRGYSGEIDEPKGTIQENKCQLVTVTNTESSTVPLTIRKTVRQGATYPDILADAGKEFVFRVTLSNGDEAVNGTFSGVSFRNGTSDEIRLHGDESKTIEGLPDGCTYTVTEEDPGDWYEVKMPDNASGTLSEGHPVTVEVVNDMRPCSLSVTKTVTNQTSSMKNPDGVPISKYLKAVRETFGFSVRLTKDGEEPIAGSFKGTIGDEDHTFTPNENGVVRFSLKDGQTAKIEGLPLGCDYSISEDPYDQYEVTSTGEEGTLESDAVVTFTNKMRTGRLKLVKQRTSQGDAGSEATGEEGVE